MEVPISMVYIYGIIERIVILVFILTALNKNIKIKKLLFMSVILTTITMLNREISSNYILIISVTVITNVICLKYFYKDLNLIKTFTITIISMLITIFAETIFLIQGMNLDNFNFYAVWIITGLPHLILLGVITLILRKINYVRKNKNQFETC